MFINTADQYASLFRGELLPSYEKKTPLDGSTYFAFSKEYETGSVLFRGKRYNNVLLNLDAHLDELCIAYPAFSIFICVNKHFVDEFTIGKLRFIHYKQEPPSLLSNGYYQVLYAGNVKLYKKIQKIVSYGMSATTLSGYQLKETFYLWKDDSWYRINSKKKIIELFPEQKQVINKYVKATGYSFRKNKEIAILSTIEFIDNL